MFTPLAQYKIPTNASAVPTANLAIPEVATILSLGRIPQAIMYAKGADIIYKFGDSTVAADQTAPAGKEVAGNYLVAGGAVYTVPAMGNLSAVSEDGATAGTLFVTIGYGDNG